MKKKTNKETKKQTTPTAKADFSLENLMSAISSTTNNEIDEKEISKMEEIGRKNVSKTKPIIVNEVTKIETAKTKEIELSSLKIRSKKHKQSSNKSNVVYYISQQVAETLEANALKLGYSKSEFLETILKKLFKIEN